MIDEQRVGKNLGGNGHGFIDALSRHLPGEKE
jgi:hypothetical protein